MLSVKCLHFPSKNLSANIFKRIITPNTSQAKTVMIRTLQQGMGKNIQRTKRSIKKTNSKNTARKKICNLEISRIVDTTVDRGGRY